MNIQFIKTLKNQQMKLLYKKSMFIVILSLTTVITFAQQAGNTKPFLYASQPQTINVDESILSETLTHAKGTTISVSLSPTFHFNGTVIANANRQNNLQIIAIRSSENNESILQLSKITNRDNTISYTGRIINENAADGYLIKNNNGIYSLQKFETKNVLEPCKL
jgi:hypothetical protein